MSLSDYVSAWRRYIHYAVLSGLFLSDRFFYHQFIRYLDPLIRSILESRLDLDLRAFPLGTPLPLGFDPDRLLSKLSRYASFAGRPDLLEKSPRDLSRGSSALVHSLSASAPADDLLLAALDAGSARSCFVCGAIDHLVADCPVLNKLRGNSNSRRLLSRLLRSPPRHARSSPSFTAAVHQISSTGEGLGAGEGTSSSVASTSSTDDDDTNSLSDAGEGSDSASDFP
jgi:hypothetical protein